MKRKRVLLWLGASLLAVVVVSFLVLNALLQPTKREASEHLIRIEDGDTLAKVADRLESEGVLRSASAALFVLKIRRQPMDVRSGTFAVDASLRGDEILRRLTQAQPIRQMVLIREGLWAEEIARLLEEKRVCSAEEFLRLVGEPSRFEGDVEFPLPEDSLEGYLFPDTYDLPPLLGAERAIRRMLKAFETKVYKPLGRPKESELRRWVIVGSLIELEAMHDAERRKISGVIANRLAKGMPLQIDATVLYALKEKRRLKNSDYRVESEYNTYQIPGLPPGPICSPGVASIRAAANPERHDYLYYVARPDGYHAFATTYAEHLRNVRMRNAGTLK
ncbi:MAG: aminodeoxychorismate lyase [Fimbriimonadales bacterium]|nr:MAG: aminodeoxychorismate lyase [Fimbriimonadales bacterium]